MDRRYNRAVDPDLRAQIIDFFATAPGVAAVYLFGSTARGDDHADSDIDVAVLFEVTPPKTLHGRFALGGELERALGRPVDLIVMNDAPVDLRIRILREGELLVDRNRAIRIAAEVRTRNEYFDLEPVLTLYRSPRRTP
jgi:predicted nucleotidyltransferase